MVGIGNNFGKKYLETGTFGKKGLKKLETLGYGDQDSFLKANNLNQDSSAAAIRIGGRNANKGQNNIDNSDFAYDNLPTVGQQGGVGQDLRDAGNQATEAGRGLVGGSMDTLTSLLGNIQNQSGNAFNQGRMSQGLSLRSQQMAENPTLNPEGQQYFNDRAQGRTDEVNKLFGKGGAEQEQLGRDLSSNIANLDELGVSGTSESNTLGNLLGNFQGKKYQATQAANELSRNEQLGERQDTRSAGLNLAGLRSGEGLGQNQLGAGLLSTGTSGSLGAGQLGSDLQKTGISANDAALGREGEARDREAGLQQSERAFNTNLQQNYIDNWLRNQGIEKGSELEKKLLGLLGLDGSKGV